jgi:hypothetical protein
MIGMLVMIAGDYGFQTWLDETKLFDTSPVSMNH